MDPHQNLLCHAGRHQARQAKTMGVLIFFAEHADAVIWREELLDRVWGEMGGSDEALSRAVSLCRSAFARLGAANVIRTAPRGGYTLIGEVVREVESSYPERAAAPEARALYLRGRAKAARIANPSELSDAVALLLQQATWLDPDFARGRAALAHAQASAAGFHPRAAIV